MKTVRFAIAIGACAVLVSKGARAGAREEAAAKNALARARTEHARHHYNRAAQILSAAEKSCEPDQCSPTTLALLLRDIGTMQILNGDDEKARGNFAAALAFDGAIDLDPAYATTDVRVLWNEVKSPSSQQQPSGDFDHTPPAEQKKDVPLPVYVDYQGSAHPASVVVRYEQNGTYRRLALVRVGKGWGNVIPCGAIKLGTLHYYFQGLDNEGLPILDSGNKRHPYFVQIKSKIDGPAPRLPGHAAPTMCGEGMEEEEHQATSPETTPTTPSGPSGGFARVWLGVSASFDFTVLPAGSDVCSRDASGNSVDANWSCTSDTPEGTDFPRDQTENATLVSGKSGVVSSGVQPANVRVKATFDYAVTPNLLIGAALGFVAGAYGGSVAPKFPPIHLEARATWVFGDEPIAHAGFAPYAQLAGGVGEYDANIALTVAQSGVAGERPVQAWHVGGPGFVALEGGLRYAFGARSAFLLGVRATAAFGASFFPAFGPDLALQFGL